MYSNTMYKTSVVAYWMSRKATTHGCLHNSRKSDISLERPKERKAKQSKAKQTKNVTWIFQSASRS